MVTKETKTRFGAPFFVRILYFITGGFTFAAGMQSSKMIHNPSIGFVGWLSIMAFFSLLGFCGYPVSRLYQNRQQRLRDQRAALILSQVRAGQESAYSLYLRGFETTGKLPVLWAHHDYEYRGSPEPSQDIEAVVAQVMEPAEPLIALGRPGEQLGAGRVETSEEDWQDDFRLLSSGAKTIILFPTDTPGTLFEMEQIISQRLWDRTILLMPQEDRRCKWAERWASMCAKVSELGLELPRYRLVGMVFKLSQQCKLELFQPIEHRQKDLGEIVLNLIDGVGLRPGEDLVECPACGNVQEQTGSMKTICRFCKRTTASTHAQNQHRRICPSCGAGYRLSDYNLDVTQIFCASCKQPLPKD